MLMIRVTKYKKSENLFNMHKWKHLGRMGYQFSIPIVLIIFIVKAKLLTGS